MTLARLSIELHDTEIVLDDSGESLTQIDIAQIKYLGFSWNGKYILRCSDKETRNRKLQKLITYLNRNKYSLQLSANAEQVHQQFLRMQNDLETARSIGKQIKEGDGFKDEFEDFISFTNQLPRKLKDHQLIAAFHLYKIQNGANFSVPGSGKTTTILSVYERLKSDKQVSSLFVVGPISCFHPWIVEFEASLGRVPQFQILSGGDPIQRKDVYYNETPPELLLTTFQTLLNDLEHVTRYFNREGNDIFLVIDEAHYIKRTDGLWATALLQLARYAKYRCILTGTPIPRSHMDVFNLFDVLWPEVSPLSTSNKNQIQLLVRDEKFQQATMLLREKISPLFYRVRKSDLGLTIPDIQPPKQIVMNPVEREIYEAIHSSVARYVSADEYIKDADILERLRRGRMIRLRQAVSYTKLLHTALEGYDEQLITENRLVNDIINYDSLEVPAKVECLLSMIRDFQKRKEKVVVWSNFINTLQLIHRHLLDAGIAAEMIYGETPHEHGLEDEDSELRDEKSRESIRDEFVDPQSGLDVLIANPAACAESISLHKTCQNAIYYDLSYNCAQYLQSLDRIHRVGGSETKISHYFFLQYQNTFEGDIKENLDLKAQRMYDVIENDLSITPQNGVDNNDDAFAFSRLFSK